MRRQKKKRPAVSILMAAYRAHGTIQRAIASVRTQSFQDWELIIASDDGFNYAKLYGDQDPRILSTHTGGYCQGAGVASNLAYAKSRGEYVVMLDAHDEFRPDKLSALLPLAERQGIAFDAVECIGENPAPDSSPWTGDQRDPYTAEPTVLLNGQGPFFPPFFPLIHRELVGQWAEDLPMAANLLVTLGAAFAVDEVGIVARPLHRHYVQPLALRHGRSTAEVLVATYSEVLHRLESQDGAFGLHRAYRRPLQDFFTRRIAEIESMDAEAPGDIPGPLGARVG